MISEREILEAMLNSTPEQCRAAGELFLALADQPRDIHFKADLQRRIAALPIEASDSRAVRLAVSRNREAGRGAELWRIGWHPIQLLSALKSMGYQGNDGALMPPSAERLLELHADLADAGMAALDAH